MSSCATDLNEKRRNLQSQDNLLQAQNLTPHKTSCTPSAYEWPTLPKVSWVLLPLWRKDCFHSSDLVWWFSINRHYYGIITGTMPSNLIYLDWLVGDCLLVWWLVRNATVNSSIPGVEIQFLQLTQTWFTRDYLQHVNLLYIPFGQATCSLRGTSPELRLQQSSLVRDRACWLQTPDGSFTESCFYATVLRWNSFLSFRV